MCSQSPIYYKDANDDVVYAINPSKFAPLHEHLKRHVMMNLMNVHNLSHDCISLSQIECQPSKVLKSAPLGGFCSSRQQKKRPVHTFRPPQKRLNVPLKFELGIFPSDDFRYSSDTSCIPAYHHRVEQPSSPMPRIVNSPNASLPTNVLIGNLAFLKHNSNAHNFVAATGLYSSPSQSFFTYFYGSSVDQYYHVFRNGFQ